MVVSCEIALLAPRWTKHKQKPFAFAWLLFEVSPKSGIAFTKLSSDPLLKSFWKLSRNNWFSWGRSRVLIRWSKCQLFGRRWWQGKNRLSFQFFARWFCHLYMWKRNMESFSNETLNFFFRKFWASYILDLAKTVRALRILSQKSTRNFGIKELWALENHVLVNMLLCSSHFTEVH